MNIRPTAGSRRRATLSVASLLCLMVACALMSCAISAPGRINESSTGPRFVLELSPGDYYRTTTKWFIFDIPIYPQLAAWVETLDGKYLGTIHVTAKAESNGWKAAPKEGRPEALPVWSHLRQGELDAVSAATSAGNTLRNSGLAARLAPGTYHIMLETNRSYDYNDTWTRDNAGVTGQPSLVYRAKLDTSQGPATAVFEPIGTGAVDGSDGSVRNGLAGIDTALRLFSTVVVSYRE